jgi:hypothetical protein
VASAVTNAVELSIAAFDHGETEAIGHQEIVLLFTKNLDHPAKSFLTEDRTTGIGVRA